MFVSSWRVHWQEFGANDRNKAGGRSDFQECIRLRSFTLAACEPHRNAWRADTAPATNRALIVIKLITICRAAKLPALDS
jgi:hypothetical protein